MDIRQLLKTDLNLLVTLYVLFEERSASKAAERLFVTQSAVSKSLSRLRELFNDPLFSRVGHNLVPTPYLESLIPGLIRILNDTTHLLQPAEFDPQTSRGEIKVAFSETIELIVMPWLLAYLQRNAPGISIVSKHYDSELLPRLASGDLDFAISMEYIHYPPEFRVQDFLHSRPVIFARSGHPLKKKKEVDFKAVSAYPRINVDMPDAELTEFLQKIYALRESKIWPAHFETESLMTALSIVRLTDSLLPCPDVLTQMIMTASDLEVFQLAEFQSEMFNFVLVSHERTDMSVMHQWMHSVLMAIGKQISADEI